MWPLIHWHDWSKWETIESGKLMANQDALGLPLHDWDEKPVIGAYETQRRVCTACGASQLREVRA